MRTNTTLLDGNTKNNVAFVSGVGHVTKRIKTRKQLLSFSSFLHTPEWVSECVCVSFFLSRSSSSSSSFDQLPTPHGPTTMVSKPTDSASKPRVSFSLSFFNSTITKNSSLFRCFNSSFPFLIHRNRFRNYVSEFDYSYLEFWIWSDNHERTSFKSSLFLCLPVIECYSNWVRE